MVCIAAFIVLVFLSLSLPVVRLFNRSLAETIWQSLTAAWRCVGRRVTFRVCDTTFKQDIEHTILRRVIRKNPALVTPVRVAIEVISVIIVVVTVWSLLAVVKSGLSLYVYGTCDVQKPSACALSQTEACSIDNVGDTNPITAWFTEWGDLFTALPGRMTSWDAAAYIPKNAVSSSDVFAPASASEGLPVAVDIFDPGCIVCKQSFEAQLSTGFLASHRVYLMPYSIKTADGYKFKHSRLVAQYVEAVRGHGKQLNEWVLIKRLFTEKAPGSYLDYQQAFNSVFSAAEAEATLLGWLKDAGAHGAALEAIQRRAHSPEIEARLEENHRIVDQDIRTKYIPTMLYDGRRHEGLFKAS